MENDTIKDLLYILIAVLICTLIGYLCLNVFTFGLVVTIILKVICGNGLLSSTFIVGMIIKELNEYESQMEKGT